MFRLFLCLPASSRSLARATARVVLSALLTAAFVVSPLHAGGGSTPTVLSVKPERGGIIRVEALNASARELIAAVSLYEKKPLQLQFEGDTHVTLRSTRSTPRQALLLIAAAAGLQVIEHETAIVLRDPREPVLNLDVKNADVRQILRAVKEQCGIPNLLIDSDVTGRGTFLFKDVPCSQGIRTILSSLGLGAEFESRVVHVSGRP